MKTQYEEVSAAKEESEKTLQKELMAAKTEAAATQAAAETQYETMCAQKDQQIDGLNAAIAKWKRDLEEARNLKNALEDELRCVPAQNVVIDPRLSQ